MKSTVRDRMIILSDIHVPYHNHRATKTAFDFIKQEKPQIVAINGDAIDFYAISRYSKDPKRRLELPREIGEFNDFLSDLQEAAGKAQIIYVSGNHEARWNKYLRDHAVELEGLRVLSLPEVFQLKKRNIIWAKDGFTYGSCFVVHGDGLFGGKSGFTVTKWMDRYMASCVVGHIHRLAVVHRRTATGRLFGVEAGTLSSFDPSYEMTGFADWQTGFASLTRYKNDLIVPAIHEIVNDSVYGHVG